MTPTLELGPYRVVGPTHESVSNPNHAIVDLSVALDIELFAKRGPSGFSGAADLSATLSFLGALVDRTGDMALDFEAASAENSWSRIGGVNESRRRRMDFVLGEIGTWGVRRVEAELRARKPLLARRKSRKCLQSETRPRLGAQNLNVFTLQ